jgi:hypothetical protein
MPSTPKRRTLKTAKKSRLRAAPGGHTAPRTGPGLQSASESGRRVTKESRNGYRFAAADRPTSRKAWFPGDRRFRSRLLPERAL